MILQSSLKEKPDEKLAYEHIGKAEHNLKALIHNKKDFSDWSINMGFYTMYHCCLAIISKFGYHSKNQQCTLSVIELLIEENKIDESFAQYVEKIRAHPDKKENQIISMREDTQYTPILKVDEKKIQEILELCQDMVNESKGIIG